MRLRQRASVYCVDVMDQAAISLNFEAIDRHAAELGANTEAERAELLHTTPSSLSRWRRGRMDITLGRAVELAEALNVTLSEIVATPTRPGPPRPSPPPPQPKPPKPGAPRPPSRPREDPS